MNKQTKMLIAAGVIGGFLNGLFGSGGGVIAVMLLRKVIPDENRAHATSTLVIFIMSCVSFIIYLIGGSVPLRQTLPLLPAGVVGAVIGALFLKKIKAQALRKLFAALLVVSGAVMLLR